jgi:hypothetical protein
VERNCTPALPWSCQRVGPEEEWTEAISSVNPGQLDYIAAERILTCRSCVEVQNFWTASMPLLLLQAGTIERATTYGIFRMILDVQNHETLEGLCLTEKHLY